MTSILLAHAARYPKMEPRDAVKLIYQNEFGGGHLIRNNEACLDFLRREYESVSQSGEIPLWEDIGNGIIRVNLAALDAHGLSVDTLGAWFLRSAATQTGDPDSFRKKLDALAELTRDGKMPFSADVLSAYLDEYAAAGYPAVSHSETYRNAYLPAYRIIRTEYLPDQVL